MKYLFFYEIYLGKKYLNAIKKTSEKRIIYSCIFCGASAYYVIRPFVRSEFDTLIN